MNLPGSVSSGGLRLYPFEVDSFPTLELATKGLAEGGIAKGGDAVARDPDGRVVFVDGALPDERVLVEIFETKKGFHRGRVVEIIEPSAQRIEPTCSEVANGCGGCDLQITSPEHQLALKVRIVQDALERIGKIDNVPDIDVVPLPESGYRTSVRCVVVNGKAGFRSRRSHDAVVVDQCDVAHPLIQDLIANARFDGATEVTMRVGAATGERMVIASPTAAHVTVPDDVILIGTDELAAQHSGGHPNRAWIHDEVAGRTWRVSAESFFQTRSDGAAALVDVVRDAIGVLPAESRAFDLYGGVGLFAGTVFPAGCSTVMIEQNESSVADARVNLADLDTTIVRSKVETWSPRRADVVVADPARQGLGRNAVSRIAETDAPVIVLVSCDAASLARDTGLLARKGYQLDAVTLVDLFPMTSHTETVSRFTVT